jgi:SAM-dependent methyltransferase
MRYRSTEPELMDDFQLEGSLMIEALDKIAWVNRMLGGNRITINAVMDIAKNVPDSWPIRITDLGCGNGDMLRALSQKDHKRKVPFCLKGIDANPFTVKHARELSASYSGIEYECCDILRPDFEMEETDITLLTLTLHHFTEQQIAELLHKIAASTRLAIVVNDLQRSRLAYGLFILMSKLLQFGALNDKDGRVSIQRGFTRNELKHLSRKMNFKKYTIRWKWAFRYCWVITDL